MKKTKFVIDRLAKIVEQGIVNYKDISEDILSVLKSKRDEIVFKMKLTSKEETDILSKRIEKLEKKNNHWLVTTSDQVQFETPNIIIAAGVGSFEPRKPPIKDIEKFEKTNLFYSVKDKNKFKDQTVCIFGGGDSALDWTVELSKISKKIILVHRREEFRAAQHTVNLARELEKNGKVEILTNYQPVNFNGNDKIKKVEKIKDDKQNPEKIDNEVKQVSEFEKKELFDPNNIAALIDKSKVESSETINKTDKVTQDQQKNLENIGLSLSEEDALKAQIFGCWSIPLGLPYNENLLVRIKLQLNPDGTVSQSEIIDHARMNKPGQGFYKVLAESALRAVKLCQPLRVPTTGYERWKELQLNFDAREMLEG